MGFLVLTSVFILCGCGLTGNLIDWKGDRELDEYVAGRQRILSALQQYIGKTSEDIKEDMGEPKIISYRRKFNNVDYEERWDYMYHKGIPLINSEGCMVSFFLNHGKVSAVDVL